MLNDCIRYTSNQRIYNGGNTDEMERLIIQLPVPLKAKIDALRGQGYTASGYIRAVLKRELKNAPIGRKER